MRVQKANPLQSVGKSFYTSTSFQLRREHQLTVEYRYGAVDRGFAWVDGEQVADVWIWFPGRKRRKFKLDGDRIEIVFDMSPTFYLGAECSGVEVIHNGRILANYEKKLDRWTSNYVTQNQQHLARPIPPISKGYKKIFVSYRREDSGDVTGRIFDRLGTHFGTERVFKDTDTFRVGEDFRKSIETALKQCDVVLAIIGDHWLTIADSQGRPRLYTNEDFVRFEIEWALRSGKRVIPVLVRNAVMPRQTQLPPELVDLAFRNALKVRSDPDFHSDLNRLIAIIEH